MSAQTVDLKCPSCGLTQPAELDECGASIDLVPCQGSEEKHQLCPYCRFLCSSCELHCCEDHSVEIPVAERDRYWTYGSKIEHVCKVCMAERLVRS